MKSSNDARYTTLTTTSRSGFDVDEDRVAKIVKLVCSIEEG
jgi:hypothetical protein